MKGEQIERLEALLAKATPGPWRVVIGGNIGNLVEAQSGRKTQDYDDGMRAVCSFQYCGSSENYYEQREVTAATGELIAEAINALPALLQLARAVSEAPKVLVSEFMLEDIPEGMDGQTVALVPVPVKEGEG